VFGETIIDEYRYVRQLTRSNKDAATCGLELGEVVKHLGGSRAVYCHVIPFVRIAEIFTSSIPVVKRRYITKDWNVKLFQSVVVPTLDDTERTRLLDSLMSAKGRFDVLMVLDYGHGLIDRRVARALGQMKFPFKALNIQANSYAYQNSFRPKWNGTNWDLFACNEDEAMLYGNAKPSSFARLCLRTLGKKGICARERELEIATPGFTVSVADRLGAGDASFCLASLARCVSDRLEVVSFLANCAGALKTQNIFGNERGITKEELCEFIRGR